MRRLLLLLAALFTVVPALADGPYRLIIGDRMPDVDLPRLDGRRIRTSSLYGHRVALSFYSPYCGPCEDELPTLARVIDRVNQGAADKVSMVVIAIDGSPGAATLAKAPLAQWLLDENDKARAAFDPRTLPCTFLVDETGMVRHINRGFGKGYEARVTRWLASMRAGDGGAQ